MNNFEERMLCDYLLKVKDKINFCSVEFRDFYLDLKKQLFYKSEIYKILNDDLNNCSKDLSNRFEKMLLINNIL